MKRFHMSSALAIVGLIQLGPATLVAQQEDVSLPLGTPAPTADVEDLDGNPVQLLDLIRSKPALVEFWATWCELCEQLQPQLDRIQAEYGNRLNVVAVAVGVAQNQRRIKRHLEDHDPGYPYVYDYHGNAVRAYQAAITSIVLLVDASGKVVYSGVGGEQDLVGAVEKMLASTQ